MKKDDLNTFKSKHWLLIICIICVVLMGFSLRTDRVNRPFRSIVNYTIVPMQKGMNTIGVWMNDLTKNFETMQELREKNHELQAKVDDLTTKNNMLLQEKYELDRLRELFELDQKYKDYDKIGANVTASDSGNWFSSFTIDKGEQDGIEVDMNVMAGTGLVGIVTEVGPNWAKVCSIIDDTSKVSA